MAFWRRKRSQRTYYVRPRPRQWFLRPRRHLNVQRRERNSVFLKQLKEFCEKLFSNFFYRTLAVLAIFLALTFIALSTFVSIKSIEVLRQDLHINSAKVENALNDYLNRSIILVSKRKIAQKIVTAFPEFQSVQVRKIFPSRIQVVLESHPYVANLKAYHTETKGPKLSSAEFSALNQVIQELAEQKSSPFVPPLAVTENTMKAAEEKKETLQATSPDPSPAATTPAEPVEVTIEQKGLLNAAGQAIFDQEENLELMTITIRDLGRPILDREQVIEPEHMQYIIGSLDYLSAQMNLTVASITYFTAGREIHLKTQEGLFIWLTLEQTYADQIDKLRAIYETAELNKQDLKYIDLRIREKVIYCPANAACRKLVNE